MSMETSKEIVQKLAEGKISESMELIKSNLQQSFKNHIDHKQSEILKSYGFKPVTKAEENVPKDQGDH